MATKKPRVQVLLSEQVLQIYTDAAAVFGVSASKLSGEVLTEAAESIKKMASIMASAKSDQADAAVRAAEGLKGLLVDARQTAADAQIDLEDEIAKRKLSDKAQEQPKPKAKAKSKPRA